MGAGAASGVARECSVFGQWSVKVKALLAPLTYPGTPKHQLLTVTSTIQLFFSQLKRYKIRSCFFLKYQEMFSFHGFDNRS